MIYHPPGRYLEKQVVYILGEVQMPQKQQCTEWSFADPGWGMRALSSAVGHREIPTSPLICVLPTGLHPRTASEALPAHVSPCLHRLSMSWVMPTYTGRGRLLSSVHKFRCCSLLETLSQTYPGFLFNHISGQLVDTHVKLTVTYAEDGIIRRIQNRGLGMSPYFFSR